MLRPEELLIAETHRTSNEILGHPDFPTARATFVDSVLGLYEHDAYLNRLLMEAGRHVMFMLIICLHARYRPEVRSTWPTIGRLKQAMAQFGLTSPRRIDGLVARLADTKLVSLEKSPVDARVRLLTPSNTMFEYDADWLIANYSPLQRLYPEPGYSQIAGRDRDFQIAYRSIACDFFAHGAQILAGNPDILVFLTHDVGFMGLMKLIQMASLDRERATAGMSYAEIGERFGATRTHIRKVMQLAEQAELVTLVGRGGARVRLSPRVMTAFDRFVAESMSGHDLLYQLTKSATEAAKSAG